MAECTGIGPHITPPGAQEMEKQELMKILGVGEIEISMTDKEGKETTAVVLGRIKE